MKRTRPGTFLVTAVLVALLLQSFASVQSIIMMATASAYTTPICDSHSDDGTAEAGTRPQDHQPGAPHGHEAACPFCAAAAHAPIMAHAPPLQHAVGFVFIAFRVIATHGPRGPPAYQFRARAPPLIP